MMVHHQANPAEGNSNVITGYKWIPVLNEELCTGCRACVTACASRCWEFGSSGDVHFLKPSLCKSNGRCADACPSGGLTMQWELVTGNPHRGIWKN